MCFWAPWSTRALLLVEKGFSLDVADVRGFLADGSVALAAVGIVGVCLASGRVLGRIVGWLAAATFVVMTVAIYELVAALESHYALQHAHFLADGTFLGGSATHLGHPVASLVMVAATLPVFAAAPPSASWWKGAGVALAGSIFLHAAWPMSPLHDDWRQRHAVHSQVSLLPASPRLGSAGTVGAEARQVFEADLTGERRLGPLDGRPNVLLVMVEAASGAVLPSVAADAKVVSTVKMPRLDALAKDHLLFTHVVSHQRQTNRGEYAILCGDYPKLLSDQSKMTEQVYGEPRRCLPAILRDHGYATAYIQAAPLAFMLKDQFMRRAGFDLLKGDAAFPKSYARTDWGIDDKAFFEQALDDVRRLHAADAPFFAALLTVGTHHPYTFPDPEPHEPKTDRQKRAFRYADDALGDFVAALERDGILSDTVVIITSDESAPFTKTSVPTRRVASEGWSFALALLPEPRAERIDTLYAHVDIALSLLDLLGLEGSGHDLAGRSLFREYDSARPSFAGNTYARAVMMWKPGGAFVTCDESFRTCSRHGRGTSPFVPKVRLDPARPRERRLLRDVARLSRSGRANLRSSGTLDLIVANEVRIPASQGKKLLTGGQYLRVPSDTTLRVDFALTVAGPDSVVEVHQDVFLEGHERFSRTEQRVRDGERWELSYELYVPEASSQLVVQLYATTVEGTTAVLGIERAELEMRRGGGSAEEPVITVDRLVPSHPR